jgi:hypothetical protein
MTPARYHKRTAYEIQKNAGQIQLRHGFLNDVYIPTGNEGYVPTPSLDRIKDVVFENRESSISPECQTGFLVSNETETRM